MNNKHYWRKDITGLRALAVIPVLIFHAFPELLPGGFYGVDIFFVISGYLISGIIFRGLCTETFSFKDFYIKRIKRIFPNLIVLLTFVLFVGWFVATSGEYGDIGSNVYRSAFFYQNFRLMEGEGYFNPLSKNNPLLHMWSLSVEEQFYLLFPLVAFLLWKIGRNSVHVIGFFIGLMTVTSFVCCLWIEDQNIRFYFPLSRFWELGGGICIAYAETFFNFNMKNHSKISADVLSVLGFVLVFVALLIPTDWYSPAPGVFSLMPVLGSVLLISSGTQGVINRTLLSWRWMIFVGLISYSLYLWHWPLLAYLRMIIPQPSSWMIVLVLLASILVACLVFHYVENPIRRLSSQTNKIVISVLLIGLIFVFYVGKLVRIEHGFPSRPIAQLLPYDDWTYPQGLKKLQKDKKLRLIDLENIPEIIFVGDSHVEQYHARVMKLASEANKNIGFLTSGGCMVSVGKNVKGDACADMNELNALIEDQQLKTIVIGQKWGGYTPEILEQGWKIYRQFATDFLSHGKDRRVFVLFDNPWDESVNREFDFSRMISNRFYFEPKGSYPVALPKSEVWKKGNDYVEAHKLDFAVYISTVDKICPNGICDLLSYKDDDHLRSTYVRDHATWIDQVFE